MPTDIVEMLWGCLVCKAESKGRFKTCQSCGKPRTEDSPEWMPGDVSPMAAVTDSNLLKKAKAGIDWTCKFCSSSQFRADGNCAQCGSSREVSVISPEVMEYIQQGNRAKTVTEDKSDIDAINVLRNPPKLNTVSAKQEEPLPFVEGGGYREAPVRAVSVETDPFPPPSTVDEPEVKPSPFIRRNLTPWVLGLVGIGLILLCYFLFRTKDLNAEVTSVQWTKTVAVERYSVWRHEGWTPGGGAFNVHDEGSKFHHYDHVLVGSHQESYPESYVCGENCSTPSCYTTPRNCTSNKNGFATCTGGDQVCPSKVCFPKNCNRTAYRTVNDYQDVPRFQEWYSWSAWEWARNRSIESSGNSTETYFPSDDKVALGRNLANDEQERIESRKEYFKVHLQAGSDTYNYEPKSDEEFQRFFLHKTRRIRVGVVHGVEVLR